MSLLTAVETAIRSCKDEQARVNGRIQFYKELLKSLTAPEEPEPTNDAPNDTATSSPLETHEMKLLEKALEKALHVRTGTRFSSKYPKGTKPTQFQKDITAMPKEATLKASAAFKGNQTTIKSTLKSASSDRKVPKKPVTSSRSSAACGPGKCKSTTSKNVTKTQSKTVHHQAAKSVQHNASVSITGENITTSGEHQTKVSAATSHGIRDAGDHSLPQPRREQSNLKEQWICLRLKQNRMWDKVMAAQRKPVPGRSRFMERMRATFPKDWPPGSPEQIGGLVGRLTHQVDELAQQCQTMGLLDPQTPEQGAEPGIKENRCFCLTPERLQITALELRNITERAKQEWEAWDRWRPEGVCLYAAGPEEDEAIAPHLPVTITYASEAELRQLEAIRMRVALLQQEIYLQQALLDALSPQLASIIPSCTNYSVLRGLYSLLGEGGQRFPAIVLDSETE
ncbi:tubulin epsilon and delta complex protein 2 [Vanacampus margaritifer]